jgi:inner membrane transporter RhtA
VALGETSAAGQRALTRAPSGLLVVGAISSVQFGSAIAAGLFARTGPGGAVLLRLLTASVMLLALWRPRLGHGRRELVLAALFGLVLAGMNLCFYHALHRIPLGITVTFEFIGPLAVAISGSRRVIDVVWVVLAAAGILALTHGGGRHGLDGLGVVLALAAGCLWGCYILLNARLGRAFARGDGLALAMCVATFVALPIGVAEGGAHLLEPRSLLLGTAVGLLSSAIPYSLELEALRRIAAPVFGVLMSLEPGMAALAGFLVLGQGLSARAVIGIALVVAASIGASRRTREAPLDA